MREIKFRVWDGDRMISWEELVRDYGDLALVFEWPQGESPTREVMQFTGLLDKNGKDVYEGDIVKDYHGDTRVVVYRGHAFWLEYPNGDAYWPNGDFAEVVGNIYESPDLLK